MDVRLQSSKAKSGLVGGLIFKVVKKGQGGFALEEGGLHVRAFLGWRLGMTNYLI